jgi:tetratricopeptide (TPR) repeat protein
MQHPERGWRGIIFLACLLVVGAGRYHLHVLPKDGEAIGKEVLLAPPGKVLRRLDLGWHSLAADLLFIRANLYYGHHILSDEQLPWLASFIDTLLELDPDFRKVYLWGAMVTVHNKRVIEFVPEDLIQRSTSILKMGMRRFPEDHRFPMRIAFNYYYELGDADQAIPYFERAARIPGAPDWLKKKLVDLYSTKGRLKLARQTLAELIMETEDPVLSQALRDRLAALMNEEEREKFVASRRAIMKEWQAVYGFIPLDLFLLIREP